MSDIPPARLYPLKFDPIYKEKVWGGRTLERIGRTLPGGATTLVGESWELVDLASTSASGGGGGAEHSRISNGPLAGQTLAQVIATHGRTLLGHLPLTESDTGQGGFPILLKYLDAAANLSVQVHPSPDYAAAHEDAHLKSESWYVVRAEPGSVIYKGIQPGVTPEQLRAAIRENTDSAVVPLMIEVPVKAGDCHYVPSGTCHALGAGILVAEVQTPSDTTYRVYDWGREGRELHVEQALKCIDFGPPDVSEYELFTALPGRDGASVKRLVACEYFRIDEVRASVGFADSAGESEPTVWMLLQGQATLTCEAAESVMLHAGDTVLLPPADALGSCQVNVQADALWLEISFPQARQSQLA